MSVIPSTANTVSLTTSQTARSTRITLQLMPTDRPLTINLQLRCAHAMATMQHPAHAGETLTEQNLTSHMSNVVNDAVDEGDPEVQPTHSSSMTFEEMESINHQPMGQQGDYVLTESGPEAGIYYSWLTEDTHPAQPTADDLSAIMFSDDAGALLTSEDRRSTPEHYSPIQVPSGSGFTRIVERKISPTPFYSSRPENHHSLGLSLVSTSRAGARHPRKLGSGPQPKAFILGTPKPRPAPL